LLCCCQSSITPRSARGPPCRSVEAAKLTMKTARPPPSIGRLPLPQATLDSQLAAFTATTAKSSAAQ